MPPLTPDQLVARIAKGGAVAGVVLLGEDAYLRDLCRKHLVEAFVPEGARDWGVARLSLRDTSLEEALGRARTLPMLSPRQVLFVEDLDVLARRAGDGTADDKRDAGLAALGEYLDDPAPFTILVLEAASLDQRTRLAKLLAEKTLVVAAELPGGDDSRSEQQRLVTAAALAREMAGELGVEIDRAAAEQLADALNAELGPMRMEMEKLAAYAGARRRITAADVEAVVVSARRYTVWQLADLLAQRQAGRALTFLESLLREGEQPAGLVGAMAWMYRKLLEAQELSPRTSPGQAAGRLRMRRETAQLALRQAHRIPRRQLQEGLRALAEADSRLKSGPADPRAVLEFLIARLAAPAAAAAGR